MPTYQISAPNGKIYSIDGPDGASQTDVENEVMRQYPEAAGGSSSPAPQSNAQVAFSQGAQGAYQPPAGLSQQGAKNAIDAASAQLEAHITNLSPAMKNYARDQFFKNPTIAALRVASAVPVQSRQNAHAPSRHTALRSVLMSNPLTAPIAASASDDQLDAATAGATRDIPGAEPLAAAGERFLPSAITGNDTNADYSQILQTVRGNTNEDMAKSPMASEVGKVVGAGATGLAAGRAVGAAMEGTPLAAELAAAAQSSPVLTTLGTSAAGGAAAMGAQAANEGQPILPAIGEGALVGPASHFIVGKGLGFVTQKAANILGLSNASQILKTLTDAPKSAIQQKVDQLTAQGIEPTLFEVLPMADRNRLAKSVVGRSDETLEAAQQGIGNRIQNMGPEMSNVVENATAPGRQTIMDNLEQNSQAPIAPGADLSPSGMGKFGGQASREANAIMRPHQDREIFDNLNDLIPTHPENILDGEGNPTGQMQEVEDDPALSRIIRSNAGLLPSKNTLNPSGGLNGAEVQALLAKLDGIAAAHGTNAELAEQGAQHIRDTLAEKDPAYLAAHEQMQQAFKNRMDMSEGMSEGMNTRTQADVQTPNQKTANAYGTGAGGEGRFLGQANKLKNDFTNATPRQAINRAAGIPGDTAALEGNLGPDAAAPISEAAAAQTQGASALNVLAGKNGVPDTEITADDLAHAVMGLYPGTMINTKLRMLQKITKGLGIRPDKARNLVDMLFSVQPEQRQQALNMLNSVPKGAPILKALKTSIASGIVAQSTKSPYQAPEMAAPPAVAAPPAPPQTPEMAAPAPDMTPPPAAPSPTPTEAPAPASDPAAAAMFDQLGVNASPETKALLAQIRAAGAAPGQENDKTPHGRRVIQSIFPEAKITSDVRSPNDPLSKKNPNSYHTKSDKAVDVRPIPGLTFNDFLQKIHEHGYGILEARDEVNHPIKGLTTGPHWHVVIA